MRLRQKSEATISVRSRGQWRRFQSKPESEWMHNTKTQIVHTMYERCENLQSRRTRITVHFFFFFPNCTVHMCTHSYKRWEVVLLHHQEAAWRTLFAVVVFFFLFVSFSLIRLFLLVYYVQVLWEDQRLSVHLRFTRFVTWNHLGRCDRKLFGKGEDAPTPTNHVD